MTWKCWRNDAEEGNLKYSGRKPVTPSLCPPQILHALVW